MRLSAPRIAPLEDGRFSDEQRAIAETQRGRDGRLLNIFRTLAHAPEALKSFLAWGGYILSDRNSLPPRERELAILRIGYLCRSGYEWTQHHRIGLRCGLSAEDIERIKAGAAADGWTRAERSLLAACDELHTGQFIEEPTWKALLADYSPRQAMDLVMTAGQYTQVCMMLNSFGIQLDEGQVLDPDLDRRKG
ncbi:MAG: carboxymuconolactone decarboxylase family protein [Alphaproteobacteria bacterium]|nr:carboxymuconolactone decarboxylase family protein [Alphaproteobacteria bacterium]